MYKAGRTLANIALATDNMMLCWLIFYALLIYVQKFAFNFIYARKNVIN